ncbi:Hsp70 family protein [Ancylobacter amanitiformis]|uniref:Chaperone protein n=1 Tax=Ancylobacter amanitiformis TaxID=217069 RepID=A0ABU0LTK3_9HYPH|nr:Hsp70 family protein [Ancylobacter amanitiformis]MDQ0512047.1 putative chaperone protein [Ancylobacter amanitiformis]
MGFCGLDFGTSNTTLGIWRGGAPMLAPLEDGKTTVPSAVFYDPRGQLTIGRAAMARYVAGEDGRLMRSLKAVLGSALIEEKTQIGRRAVAFREVIGDFIATVKRRAEQDTGAALDKVVMGRPVFFVDDDVAANARAEEALISIAASIGFREVSTQFEPIAAALDYEQQVAGEEIALIADIGGGTSDFSIVRLGPARHARTERADDILANDGVRIGGTDFDRHLSLGALMPLLGYRSPMKRPGRDVPSGYFHELATWSSINRLYTSRTVRELNEVRREAGQPALVERLIRVIEEQRGHTLAMQSEEAKIALAETPRAQVDLAWLEAGLSVGLTPDELVGHTSELAARIARRVTICLAQAGLKPEAIDALFLTGGSTRLNHVRTAIVAALPGARVVDGDTFGSVGTGLAIEAARRYGAPRHSEGRVSAA